LLKEPRPKKTKRVLEIAIANDYGMDYEYEKFGMPSGHAQVCAYSLAFITLVLNDPLISSIYLAISFLTFFQRYKYLDHSILQLIVGFIVGLCIGYMFYLIGNKFIKGNIKMRPDDCAPK
jgi:membrane-associated phospholipid phosphatase